jgi:hypothetical protein
MLNDPLSTDPPESMEIGHCNGIDSPASNLLGYMHPIHP